MDRIFVQLERLRRHYETAVKTYDHISFLDLSHTLRMWTELKEPLKKSFPKSYDKKLFKTATPARRLVKATNNCEIILAYMPGGVRTYAHNGNIFGGSTGKFFIRIQMSILEDHLELGHFIFIIGLSNSQSKDLHSAYSSESIRSCTFSHWLEAEAVRCAYSTNSGTHKEFSISREMLIKRVANTLDGSHHFTPDGSGGNNKFNAPVHYLLQFEVGGLPLPYFLLLKIAQDIIEKSNKLLGSE